MEDDVHEVVLEEVASFVVVQFKVPRRHGDSI